MSDDLRPGPPEAPVPPPAAAAASVRTLSVETPFHDRRRVALDAESYLGTPDGSKALRVLWDADRASALRVLEADLSSRQAAHEEAVREAYGPWNGPLAESMVDGLVARHGISYADAVAVATAERELARVRAEFAPPVSTVPWLDGRELAAPPRPWSDDDFARDELRAQHAGVDQFDESLWRLYAEQGKDAVHELVVERRDREVERAEAELSVTLEMALEAASTARADAKAAAEPAREPVARARRMGPF